MINHSLDPFFDPKGIVVIGASQEPTKLGYGLARNLVQSGYSGSIHFINKKGGTLFGLPIHTTIADTPDPVDLAVILIPAPLVPEILSQCGQRGIQAAIIVSGGFREIGTDGAALETEILQIGYENNIRLIGPNCIGILDTHLPIDTTFLPPPGPPIGDIAFLSHSGAICAAVIDWARGQGFGLSRLVSLGNQVDIQESDLLAPIAADSHTKVITMYLEGIQNGRSFVEIASRVTREKPVIALKVGRYHSGQKAAASHTGALAGQESAYDAAFRRAGVIRADTTEEMFDWARALAWCPPAKGRKVAVLTNAGGPGVTAADALEAEGLRLARLQPATIDSLRAILPPFASPRNPIDLLASASPQQYADSLSLVLADPGVDSVMLIAPPSPMFSTGGIAKAVIPIIYTTTKPVIVALMGDRLIQEAVEHFRAAHVPEYRFPERAAGALAKLAQRAEYLASPMEKPVLHNDVNPEKVKTILESLQFNLQGKVAGLFLLPETLSQVLSAYGIPTPPIKLAQTAEKAAVLAQAMGYPVALKIAAENISHKSDVGGVLLNLNSVEAVRAGFERIMTSVRKAHPEVDLQGVHVQPMIMEGQEVIVGAVQDAQFGPVLMFGSGGVEVEGLKDVEFALAPLLPSEAEGLLKRTWAGRKLAGYRNIPPADKTAVLDILIRLGQLANDFPELAEIEINPVRVLSPGQGAFAVDVRATIRS